MSFKITMSNSKTGISIFDGPVGRSGTCIKSCKYCYCLKLLKLYPALKGKLARNLRLSHSNLSQYCKDLVSDIAKSHMDNIRVFSFGDYQAHYKDTMLMIFRLFPTKTFYIISKKLTLAKYRKDLKDILAHHNVVFNASFDHENRLDKNLKRLKTIYKNLRLVYTLEKQETLPRFKFDTIYNVDKTRNAINLYKESGLSFCKCDVKLAKHCGDCKRCFGKGG